MRSVDGGTHPEEHMFDQPNSDDEGDEAEEDPPTLFETKSLKVLST